MEQQPTPEPANPMQVAGIVAVAAVITNVAFYFLSDMYFADRIALYGNVTPEHISGVRMSFGIFTGSVAIGAVLATIQPRIVGHVIAGLAGLAAIVGGVSALTHNMTPALPASLLLSGLMLAVLTWRSLERGRAAWSFLIGMTSVLAAVLLFGATKVRNALDVGLWTALIIPGMLAVATVALAMIRSDYREPAQ